MREKWGSSLLIVLLTLGLLSACGTSSSDSGNSASALSKIKERGKLIVGVFSDKPPFGFTNEKGELVGFDNDLARRFAQDLLGDESKIELVVVEPASRIPYLQSDKVDLIVANMTVTDERKEIVDFTNPNLKITTQVLVNNKSGIKSLNDLKGKKVIVTKGTTADIFLSKNHPDVELVKFERNTESLQALKDERGVAYAQDNFILLAWMRKNSGFTLLPEKLENEAPIAPAIKKGNTELRDWVNQELKALRKEKFLLQLYDKYLKDELGPDVSPNDIIVDGEK